jgi:hypothetical protein
LERPALALNIPERNVHPADCGEQGAGLARPVHVPVNFGTDIIDPARVEARNEIPNVLAGRFDQGRTRPIRCLAPSVQPGVGLDLQKRPVVFDPFDQKGLDVCDSHAFL